MTGALHFVGVDVKHAVVVRLAILEDVVDDRIHLSAVGFELGVDQTDTAERHDCAFERSIGLQTNDLFEILVDVSGVVRGDCGDGFLINIVDAFALALDFHEFQELVPESFRALGRCGQEFLAAIVRSVVALDEVPYIDFLVPISGLEVHLPILSELRFFENYFYFREVIYTEKSICQIEIIRQS